MKSGVFWFSLSYLFNQFTLKSHLERGQNLKITRSVCFDVQGCVC